jgi:hypothetical protein
MIVNLSESQKMDSSGVDPPLLSILPMSQGILDNRSDLARANPLVDLAAIELLGFAVPGPRGEAANWDLTTADHVSDPGGGHAELMGDVGRAHQVRRGGVQYVGDPLDVSGQVGEHFQQLNVERRGVFRMRIRARPKLRFSGEVERRESTISNVTFVRLVRVVHRFTVSRC